MDAPVIYQAPVLDAQDTAVLTLIAAQRERLRVYSNFAPGRWQGSLRRSSLARAIQGSNSIEGYNASLDDAMALVDDEPVADERTETARAIRGYRDALTYICQAAQDASFEFSKQFLKSLHFMMLGHEMSKHPGKWRPGSIFVIDTKSGDTVYTAPDIELIDPLVGELVDYLRSANGEPALIKGAMAHLNLTLIHPFKDGNGRMARALQTLVIALGGTLFPAFSSIEEWLGENTREYYGVLSEVARGGWTPNNSAHPWIRFCLKAHFQQAATLIRRNDEHERLFEKISAIAQRGGMPERAQLAMFDAALGFRVTNLRYRADAQVNEITASRDLKKLCDGGWFEPFGEKRGRVYRAGAELKAARAATRLPRPVGDPYDLVSAPRIPGI